MSLKIAFQGERGAFSEQAAVQLLGSRIELIPCDSFDKCFTAVKRGRAEACLVPIENTLAGSIHRNFDLLLQHGLSIVGETRVRIEHHLIALQGTRLGDVRRVLSHPMALEQCRRFLEQHPRLESVAEYDTAGSVKLIAESAVADWRDTAAIAGAWAARRYGCAILKRNIEDHAENHTRFWLLSKPQRKGSLSRHRPWERQRGDKTSIVFSTKNIPGALYKCLSVFALRDINLTKIESRPVRGRPFEYFFYVDLLSHVDEERCRNALRHLGEVTDFLRVLGCYKQG